MSPSSSSEEKAISSSLEIESDLSSPGTEGGEREREMCVCVCVCVEG